jgi:hypothetical protein
VESAVLNRGLGDFRFTKPVNELSCGESSSNAPQSRRSGYDSVQLSFVPHRVGGIAVLSATVHAAYGASSGLGSRFDADNL